MLKPTPTEHGLVPRPGDFSTLTEALDYAAGGVSGMNFHGPRGDLVEVLSYAALAEQAREVGGRLLSLGLKTGDRVGLIAETEADFVRAFMGCLFARLVPCPMPLPSAFGAREVYGEQFRRIVDVAGCRAVLSHSDYQDWLTAPVSDRLASREILFLGNITELPHVRAPLPSGHPDPDALAYLQFSSGTTRAPKGIAVSHRALMANLRGMAAHALKIDAGDRGVSWLPFYHDMGLVGCMLLPIGAQMSIDYLATRDFIRRPALWPAMISRGRATVSYSPSFGYQLAARRARAAEGLDLSSWRIAGIGGDMIKSANLAEFVDNYRPFGFAQESFVPSYGMAETTLALTFAPLGRGCRTVRLDLDALDKGWAERVKNDSPRNRAFALCGTPLPGHEIEIRTPEGTAAAPDEVGHVFARGPSMMQGYFGNPTETDAVLDAGGWLDTGDLGCMVDGELVLTGRGKDLIIVNGRNIWPQDIEWSVERHIQGVREGGVVAFAAGAESDAGAEEEIAIVIECRASEPNGREAMRSGAGSLIRELHGVTPRVSLSRPGTLPRTTSGKLSRQKAREMYFAGRFEG